MDVPSLPSRVGNRVSFFREIFYMVDDGWEDVLWVVQGTLGCLVDSRCWGESENWLGTG